MINYSVLSVLESALNQTATIYKNKEAQFHCPKCNLEVYKKKLIINLDTESDRFGYWHCWNCEIFNGMRGKDLISLLKKLNSNLKYINELISILKNKSSQTKLLNNNINKLNKLISLPKDFISLSIKSNSEEYQKAINYLNLRNIFLPEIITYNIGYCETGKYAGRIIIPSYDENGELNYFIARSYKDEIKPKYLNPSNISSKNIIFFDSHINWNFPITLCEGVFDAIAIKRNAIPVLGNTIGKALLEKIIIKKVKDIIIAFDSDMIITSFKYIEKFIAEGINVKFIELNKKDPSETGFNEFIKLYNNSQIIDFLKLVDLKIKYSI